MDPRRRGLLVVLLAAGSVLVGVLEGQALMIQQTPQDLYQAADQVVQGRVTGVSEGWNQDQSLIVTTVTVLPERTFKGGLSRGPVELAYPGGKVGALGLWVEDQPSIQPGEEALVFLKSVPGQAASLVGQIQGKYTLVDGVLQENGLPLDVFVQMMRGESGLSPASGNGGGSALACSWGPLGWTWPASQIPEVLRANSAGTSDTQGEFGAIRQGALAWNNVQNCSFWFNSGGTNSLTAPVRDGVNEIVWKPNAGSFVAATYIWYSGSNMLETDLVFNDNYLWSATQVCPSNAMDVWDVAAHELGHSVGLIDLYSSGCSDQTMYGYVSYGETKKRDLADQDILGAQTLYP